MGLSDMSSGISTNVAFLLFQVMTLAIFCSVTTLPTICMSSVSQWRIVLSTEKSINRPARDSEDKWVYQTAFLPMIISTKVAVGLGPQMFSTNRTIGVVYSHSIQ